MRFHVYVCVGKHAPVLKRERVKMDCDMPYRDNHPARHVKRELRAPFGATQSSGQTVRLRGRTPRGPGAGLEVRPEGGAAGVFSLHVCGLHHGRRGGGQTAASGPADDAAVSGLSSRPIVGAGVAPGDCRARPGKRLANPRLDDDDDRIRIPADDADAAVSVPTSVPTSTVFVSVRRG